MEQNLNDTISRIISDLFSQPKPGDDWNARIQRFRDGIKKLAEREETIFGKFLGILESFRTIIPDEKQRYHAAIQAVAATAKLGRDELVNAIAAQVVELAAIEKSAMPAVPAQRDQLTGWDAKAKALQSEINKVRERLAQLENEERGIVTYIAARQQELEFVEKSMQQVFTAIGSDITAVQNKILHYASENAAGQPAAQPAPVTPPQPAPPSSLALTQPQSQPSQPAQMQPEPPAQVPPEQKEATEQTVELVEQAPPLDPNLQKRCPMCGGVMNFQAMDDIWMCYTCAHEESGKGGPAEPQERISPVEFEEPSASPQDEEPRKKPVQAWTKKKACPACRMNMLWYPDEKMWRCHSCNYERKI